MKKKKWQLPVLLIVLVVCIGGYLGIKAYNDHVTKQKEVASEAAKVYLSDLGQITNLSFRNSNGDFSFYLKDDLWYYSPDVNFPLAQSKLESIVSTLTSLTAVRSFEPGDSLSAYGLEKPSYTLTAADADGNTLTLLFGGTTDDNCYAMEQDGKLIYTITSTLTSDLNCTLNDLVELETFPSVGKDALTSVTIASGTNTLTLEKQAVTTETKAETESGDGSAAATAEPQTTTEYVWYAVSGDGSRTAVDTLPPVSGDSASDLVDQFLDAVSFLSFSSCANYKADRQVLSEFGLDTPTLTLTVSYTNTDSDGKQSDASFKLSIGAVNADSSAYYAVKDDSAAVNLLSAETVSTFSSTLSALGS
jgi:hypothetical protein